MKADMQKQTIGVGNWVMKCEGLCSCQGLCREAGRSRAGPALGKKIGSMLINWLLTSSELQKVLSGRPGEILLIKLNSII